MKGIFYILAAYLVGEVLSTLIGGLVPGSVLGMVALLVALRLKVIKGRDVRTTSRLLLDNMMLFFVPVGVGLMVSYEIIGRNIWAIVVSLVVSTVLVVTIVGVIQQKIGGRKDD